MASKQKQLGGLFASLLLFLMILLPMQAQAACAGTVQFKAPAGWAGVYTNIAQKQTKFTTVVDGWYVIDLSTATQEPWAVDFNLLSAPSSPVNYVNAVVWDGFSQYSLPNDDKQHFTCPGVGNTIYVAEDALKSWRHIRGCKPS